MSWPFHRILSRVHLVLPCVTVRVIVPERRAAADVAATALLAAAYAFSGDAAVSSRPVSTAATERAAATADRPIRRGRRPGRGGLRTVATGVAMICVLSAS